MAEPNTKQIGPNPSHIVVAKPYIKERNIREAFAQTGVSEAKEDAIRLQGVTYIDSIRQELKMPCWTYATACVVYHKFRMMHADHEYNWMDACLAAIFTAGKIEDTLKKSRDIIAAAHNMNKAAGDHLSPDDPLFDQPARNILGLERLMLESSSFDFRSRNPFEWIQKLGKFVYKVDEKPTYLTAWDICRDAYRTFMPIKQGRVVVAMACLELAGRLTEHNVVGIETGEDYQRFNVNRWTIMESLLDLLDLYTQHRTMTIVGQNYSLEAFINIKIALNQEAQKHSIPRYARDYVFPTYEWDERTKKAKCIYDPSPDQSRRPVDRKEALPRPGYNNHISMDSSKTSSTEKEERTKLGQKDTTVRFMLDGNKAKEEKKIVAEYFKDEYEEYETETEEEVEVEAERERGGRKGEYWNNYRKRRDERDDRERR